MLKGFGIGVIGLIALAPVGAVAGKAVEQKCMSAKIKAAGKAIAAEMKCHAKAKAKEPFALDPACMTKATDKVSSAIAKAGATCIGDVATIGDTITTCVATLVADAPGTGKCPSSSAKVAGKGASGDLLCVSKGVTKPGVFDACRTKNDGKTGSGLTKGGGCAASDTVMDTHDCTGLVYPTVGCVDQEALDSSSPGGAFTGATQVAAADWDASCAGSCAARGCGGFIPAFPICKCYLNAGWKWCWDSYCNAVTLGTGTMCTATTCP